MRHAETVTFGGSGLDRAAHVRGNAEALGAAEDSPLARAIPFWRSKPLVVGNQGLDLGRLPLDHPVLGHFGGLRVFLGFDAQNAPVFAVDMSKWVPDEVDETALGSFFDPSAQHHPDLPRDHLFRELRAVFTAVSARDAELAATGKSLLSWHRSHRFCAKCGAESVPAEAGWQRNCPTCSAHHFPRTDPVVIMLITRDNRVLMGRSPGWPDGMYSLLAGFVEPGETIEAAVRREVFEEAGITVGAVDYLASQPWPYPSSLMLGCRGAALDDTITIDPKEIEDAMWVTREDILAAFAGEHPVLKPARKGAIAHFLLHNWLADRLD